MSLISASIPNDLNMALTEIAKLKERSKSFLIIKAIQNYILELREDEEDLRDIEESLDSDEATISLEEIERKYGLED